MPFRSLMFTTGVMDRDPLRRINQVNLTSNEPYACLRMGRTITNALVLVDTHERHTDSVGAQQMLTAVDIIFNVIQILTITSTAVHIQQPLLRNSCLVIQHGHNGRL